MADTVFPALLEALRTAQLELVYQSRGVYAEQLYADAYVRWFDEHVVAGGHVYRLDRSRCLLEDWLWARR